MIDRKALLNQASCEEDRVLYSKVYDLARSAGRGRSGSGFFLDPARCARIAVWFRDCEPQFWGGYEEAERKMLLFGENASKEMLAISAVRCTPKGSWDVSHRDVLGALMGLGLDRAKLGDILVTEDAAVIFCETTLVPFLEQSVCSVGRRHVTTRLILPEQLQLPEKQWEERTDTVASLRADCVVASVYRLSRGKAKEAISAGKVFVNWEELTSPDRELGEGDMLSLRGMGRAELTSVGGLSRKGRICIHSRRAL